MAVPTGRCNKRIRREVEVELVRPDALEIKETAIAENVSARGMRVATEHHLAPRGSRGGKLSGTWLPYFGTPRLLSAHGKQQVCCRFGTFAHTGTDGQAPTSS